MDVLVHFKNIEKTGRVEEYIERKVEFLNRKYGLELVSAEVDLVKSKDGIYLRCRLSGGCIKLVKNQDYDIFSCIDIAADKINSGLKREKELRIKKEKKQKILRHLNFRRLEAVSVEEEIDSPENLHPSFSKCTAV